MGNAKKIWDFLKSNGMNNFACAGILGNLDAESGLNPTNLQDSCQTRVGHTDSSYTAAVDSGAYTKSQFVNDSAGFGLAQWTWHTRKRDLYDFVKNSGRSIGDLNAQLEFLMLDLNSNYPSVLRTLRYCKSVEEASNAIMLKYESPADQSIEAQKRRTDFSMIYFNRFTTSGNTGVDIKLGYKYFTKGRAERVSEHFYSTEFDCHGSGCCSQTIVNENLPVHLEMIRNHFGVPVTITSPYRCETHNKRIGGAVGSRHSKGDACDIVVKGVAPRIVAQYCESIGILGIGLYETQSDGYFVHIDERSYKSFWYGQSEQPRTTFGSYNGTGGANSTNTSVVDTILNIGDKGAAVKDLQEKLIKLGYDCGSYGADGVFGAKTYDAVVKFQNAVGIGADGIAGANTLSAVNDAIKKLDNAEQTNLVGSNMIVTANLLNVRSGAGVNNKIVAQLKKGSIVSVIEDRNGWCRIKSPSGWICKEYVKMA